MKGQGALGNNGEWILAEHRDREAEEDRVETGWGYYVQDPEGQAKGRNLAVKVTERP